MCQPREHRKGVLHASLPASHMALTSSAIELGWSTSAVCAVRSLKIAFTAVVEAEMSAHSRCCREMLRWSRARDRAGRRASHMHRS